MLRVDNYGATVVQFRRINKRKTDHVKRLNHLDCLCEYFF